ncbi:hypothetical protein DBB36_07560 [Flavobacterium sp. WLB]|uniref:hypothetical protein n=1 Tax=unclassified Flavobacterium TaxID=196869 RepID=UPI0006ABB9FE|nr:MULTISPECIES: hypothetical protein [unclassified Flavobacterium]KOP38159.1 hypothetical protein AKO67_11550 [Flavobacterium sp. VMW]OWU90274.1 hypothetical protein APR43_14455 [Flavobacterium sp. NLM]PUU70688.1 hypothetical protein DBB36_07560 [Flavobacterium sp. WLB]
MNQKKSSADPLIKVIFLLKNLGFLFVLLILFAICCNNTYDRIYGDRHYKNKIENLLKNGKTVLAKLDDNYVTTQITSGNYYRYSYDFKYSFKIKDKVYNNEFTTEEFIPKDPNRLIKYLTVHYLPEDPDVNQIDAEVEYDYAKEKVDEHGIGMLLLNIFGLFITFILILYMIIVIRDKIKNIDQPIENTYQKAQFYNEVSQKTDYSNLR